MRAVGRQWEGRGRSSEHDASAEAGVARAVEALFAELQQGDAVLVEAFRPPTPPPGTGAVVHRPIQKSQVASKEMDYSSMLLFQIEDEQID